MKESTLMVIYSLTDDEKKICYNKILHTSQSQCNELIKLTTNTSMFILQQLENSMAKNLSSPYLWTKVSDLRGVDL